MSEIRDDERLLRHVHPTHWLPYKSKPNSVAFRGDRDGLSVDREELRGLTTALGFRPDHGFARLIVGEVRRKDFAVEEDPLPSPRDPAGPVLAGIVDESIEVNPAHAVIKRPDESQMQKAEARILQAICEPVCRPGACP